MPYATVTMKYASCGSEHVSKFRGEIAIYLSGLKNVDKPTVLVFPDLFICLARASGQFAVANGELDSLVKSDAPSG